MRRIYEPFAYDTAARADCHWPMAQDNWATVEGDLNAETAIIGAGYTGLSTALHMARAGAGGVVVLDAQSPGWGASGRNGGFCCLGGAKADDAALARRFGREAARDFHLAQRRAINLVAELLESYGIDADRHSDGEVVLAHSPRAVEGLGHTARELAAYGVATRLIPGEDLASEGMAGPGFHAGLHVPLGFALDPGKYAAGLARAAATEGADIRADSPVTKIRRENGGYVLETPKGQVRAKRLVLATNGYSTDDLPGWLSARYLPVQSNVIVTRPLSRGEQKAQGWTTDLMAYDSRTLLHYFRLMPDGRFLFGMRGGIGAAPRDQNRMKQLIRQDFERMFPAWSTVETPHFWSGLACLSRGLTPYAGPLGDWENAWTAIAYHGNGVAMGSYAGKLLAGLALGQPAPDHPQIMRAPLGRFPLGRFRRTILAASYRWYGLTDRL